MSIENSKLLLEMEKDKDESINVNDVLGLQYQRYRKSLYSLSLSKPSVYYELQEKVTNEIKERLVSTMYKDIYDLYIVLTNLSFISLVTLSCNS